MYPSFFCISCLFSAIGTSFIKLGVLIPVLEYFTTQRMKALFLSRLGIYVGQIIFILVLVVESPENYWRKNLRYCFQRITRVSMLLYVYLKYTLTEYYA